MQRSRNGAILSRAGGPERPPVSPRELRTWTLDSVIPGKQNKLGLFTRSDKMMSSKIASHKRFRTERIALDGRREQTKLRLHYPMLIYYRWREKRAYSHFLSSKPANAEDACEKLIYLMALMTSNAPPLPLNDVQQAVLTLRSFRSDLVEALGSRPRHCS